MSVELNDDSMKYRQIPSRSGHSESEMGRDNI